MAAFMSLRPTLAHDTARRGRLPEAGMPTSGTNAAAMQKLLVFFLSLLFSLSVSAWENFPQDDPALKVLDRDLVTISGDTDETYFYAVLSNGKDQTYLDVYQGVPWKRIHRWPVSFEGEKVKVKDASVLHIANDEETMTLIFYWNEFVGYAEAAVRQSLVYDLKSGKFTTSWSD
jgi:hypothetical protein